MATAGFELCHVALLVTSLDDPSDPLADAVMVEDVPTLKELDPETVTETTVTGATVTGDGPAGESLPHALWTASATAMIAM